MQTVRSKIANRAVTVQKPAASLKGVQRKAAIGPNSVQLQSSMKVSSPKDPAEKEADATAKKIMRMAVPEGSIGYASTGGEGVFRQVKKEEKEQKVQAKFQSPYITRFANTGIFTQPKKKEEEKIQRKAEGQPNVTSNVAADIQSSMAAGSPLPLSVRRFMEPRFQANFSNVKIHTGNKAAKLNRQLNAQAFTVGNQIFFGKDKFQPEQSEGKELIAHELTHTIQQGAVIQRREDVAVTQQSPTQVQRLGLSDILDGLADLAANVPGFTLLTVIIGRNPINMRVVERNFTNLLRGFMGLIPGGEILFQVLQSYRVVERIGIWVEQQMSAIGISYDDLRRRFTTFTDSLSWTDIFSPGDVWQRAQNIFTEPIARIRNFISRLIDRAIAWLKETFMQPLSDFCREIPGYTLVTVLLGRDPFTNTPVDRSALNVVRAFAEFIPGGTEKVNQLVESRGLQRAYEWFIQETQARNLTWARVTGTFAQAWNSLRLEDVLHPIDTLRRLVTLFRPLMGDLVSFAGAALLKLLEVIFEAVMGAGGARILAILKRGRDTFTTIIRNPVGFLGNLLGAVGQGVRQFRNNILQHLQQGVIAWLTGPVARAGIRMPERWDLRGIIGFVMQILGLTWDRIRQKLVRLMGERAVATLEAGFQPIQEIRERGLVQALRDRITEFFGQLREAALGAIKSFIQQRLVMAGIQQLLSLLSPVGAVIQAIIKTYTTVQFFIQKINQILDLVESIINSTAAIASGAIGAAAALVERTMARTIPVILDFLARFIGLGDVGSQVQGTIQGLQAQVDRMLDRAVDWIRSMAQRLGSAVVQAGVPQDPNERLRLGLDAATTAVNALAGTSVTLALINPVLAAIRIRYGFRTLQAMEVAGEWWIEGVVNPPGRRRTRKRSGEGSNLGVTTATQSQVGQVGTWPVAAQDNIRVPESRLIETVRSINPNNTITYSASGRGSQGTVTTGYNNFMRLWSSGAIQRGGEMSAAQLRIELTRLYGTQVADAIMRRGELASNMGILNQAQAHHIIPVEILRKQGILRLLIDSGWNFNQRMNGIALVEGFHGNHPNYTAYVNTRIEQWVVANGSSDTAGFRDYVENELIPHLRTHINTAKNQFRTTGHNLDDYFYRL